MPTTVEEWRTELAQLAYQPGSGIRRRYWEMQLRYLADPDAGRRPRGLDRHTIASLSPRQRAALYDDLAPDAVVTGMITRFGGFAQVDHGRTARFGSTASRVSAVY